ncbi:hypothetical protein [Legionella brunensis]|uniref:Uncharacterized protein n=1 Tax=Legionella brunensis TaxID=29422 RepID=A0A0W0STP9_9GAMM|nr:hypothetical protein [Legionella brunensis]KTC86744.1 hypothetical protein Lbru_0685 [Legionella brunensis]
MRAIRKVNSHHQSYLLHKTKPAVTSTGLRQDENHAFEIMSKYFSIVMKELNYLDSQFLTREILASLKATHFLQNAFVLNGIDKELQQSFNTFQQAISSLAEKLAIDKNHFPTQLNIKEARTPH